MVLDLSFSPCNVGDLEPTKLGTWPGPAMPPHVCSWCSVLQHLLILFTFSVDMVCVCVCHFCHSLNGICLFLFKDIIKNF